MVSQEDKDMLRQEILEESAENERYDCMMSRIECFLEADMILEAIEAMRVVKRACREYEHDWQEVADYLRDES